MRCSLSFMRAFSLIEVVLCLGLVSFCLIALLSLFSAGMNQSRDSAQTVHAAHLMTRIVSLRIAQPTNSDPSLALPRLDQAADSLATSNSLYLDENGSKVASAQNAAFQLNYRVLLPSGNETNTAIGKVSRAWAVLSWPAGAAADRASSAFEMMFLCPLP